MAAIAAAVAAGLAVVHAKRAADTAQHSLDDGRAAAAEQSERFAEQLKIAADQASAAKTSSELQRQALLNTRAYIEFFENMASAVYVSDTITGWKFSAPIKNVGASAARDLSAWGMAGLVEPNRPPQFPPPLVHVANIGFTDSGTTILGPGSVMRSDEVNVKMLDLVAAWEGRGRFYTYDVCTYKEIFSDEVRYTSCCVEVQVVADPRVPGDHEIFRFRFYAPYCKAT